MGGGKGQFRVRSPVFFARPSRPALGSLALGAARLTKKTEPYGRSYASVVGAAAPALACCIPREREREMDFVPRSRSPRSLALCLSVPFPPIGSRHLLALRARPFSVTWDNPCDWRCRKKDGRSQSSHATRRRTNEDGSTTPAPLPCCPTSPTRPPLHTPRPLY